MPPGDGFGTAALRDAVLAAWAASPARFREDANAEEDLALGPYRDRLVVELAQNASDAAGSDGRLRLRLDGGVLLAANTGDPLTQAGVAGLASLRASAKRGSRTVGRFGVGFAAVSAVADEVEVASLTGAVRFSRERTAEAVAAVPALAGELAARGGAVPLLRLPFDAPDAAPPPDGFATEVRVRVRDDRLEAVRALLDAVDPTLLLVLPGLVEVDVDGRPLRAQAEGPDVVVVGTRWRVARGSGSLDPSLLADRPVEERAADRWEATWAVPVEPDGRPVALPDGVAAVVRAPTATDDPLPVPALLAASLPLGPDRRRVLPGPLSDAVLAAAAGLLADLVVGLAPGPERLVLVPPPLARAELDASLGRAVVEALRRVPVCDGTRPGDAVVLEQASPDLVALLADVLPVLGHRWSDRQWATPLAQLGARRVDLAELTEVLAGTDRPPVWWRRLYDALPPDADALGALPVPLADGRLAPSPRGLLLAAGPVDLSPLGLRVVHPDAAAPLLLRLGAVEAEPTALLEDPRVRAAVEAAVDDDDPEPVVEAVLSLVAAAGPPAPGRHPWLAALPLRDDEGEWRPAGELLLRDGPLADVVDLDAGFGVVEQGAWSADVLAAVGVLRGFAVVSVDEAEDVDGLDDWLASLPPGADPGQVVRDLDLVRADRWPQALRLLRDDRLLDLPYVQWWLAEHPVVGGRGHRAEDADALLHGLYDVAPPGAVGARRSLAEVIADDPEDLLDRLADPRRPVDRAQLRAVHAALAAAAPDVAPAERVRAVVDGRVEVVPSEDAVVVDRPDLLPLVAPYAVVPVPLHLAEPLAGLLDLPLASEVVPPTSLLDPGGVVEHERLVARTCGGEDVEVAWLRVGSTDHVVGARGRARALAWAAGAWESRHALEARLSGGFDPAEDDLDS